MKKAGVPFTPLRMPPMKSLRTLFLYWPVSRAFRVRAVRRNAQTTLVFKKGIVHIPKQSRCASDLGAFGGDLGVRVYLGQREMTENKPHASTKRQLDLIDDGMCRRAMWAFIVAVFNKRDWCVRGSADMIILGYWYVQDDHVRLPDLAGFRARQEFRLRRD